MIRIIEVYCNFHTRIEVGIRGTLWEDGESIKVWPREIGWDGVRRTENTRRDKEIQQGQTEWKWKKKEKKLGEEIKDQRKGIKWEKEVNKREKEKLPLNLMTITPTAQEVEHG